MALAKRPTTDLATEVPFHYEAAPEAVDHVRIAGSYDLFIGGRFARPGACGNDGFGGFKAELTTTIAGKLYILQVSVGSPYWAGPGNYTINDPRATLGPSVTFTDGRGSSWDTQDVPSGPAGRFTINGDGSASPKRNKVNHGPSRS